MECVYANIRSSGGYTELGVFGMLLWLDSKKALLSYQPINSILPSKSEGSVCCTSTFAFLIILLKVEFDVKNLGHESGTPLETQDRYSRER